MWSQVNENAKQVIKDRIQNQIKDSNNLTFPLIVLIVVCSMFTVFTEVGFFKYLALIMIIMNVRSKSDLKKQLKEIDSKVYYASKAVVNKKLRPLHIGWSCGNVISKYAVNFTIDGKTCTSYVDKALYNQITIGSAIYVYSDGDPKRIKILGV